MAYRFLLEVPERLAAQANIAVSEAGDAQVVVVRNAHGRPADDPYLDLTVAAHSLGVIRSIYRWYNALGPSRHPVHLSLHGGQRLLLSDHDAGSMVAAIRRDQPWVERTIPKIGEHEADRFAKGNEEASVSGALTFPNQVTTALERTWDTVRPVASPPEGRRLAIRELNHVGIRVTDIARAEDFYREFMSMDVLGRARRTQDGGFQTLDAAYNWETAMQRGEEADVVFLRNGALVIALQRLGRGARLERGVMDHISIRVDAATFNTIKGEVLMRSMEVIGQAETAFAFRDPMGVTWEISLQSVPDFMF
jgi:catechol 2,3-dioxygenase-like lactoylglutathione lyase family enzyme